MHWSHPKRIAFRWLCVYLVLFCLPLLPFMPLWRRFVAWAGELMGVVAAMQFTGSGDTTFHYVQTLLFALVALATTVVWSVADRKRTHYHSLYLGLCVLVRLRLGIALIGYGTAKVIPSQFPPLSLERLVQPFGDASPMGLLWSFMGTSIPYTAFCGVAEMVGGVLLFFPRMTTLGAIFSIGVMSNVVALNFSYDVPVKLLSVHMLAMAVFLAAPDAKRLTNVFVLNRAAEPARMETMLQNPAFRRTAFVLEMVLLIAVTGASLAFANSQLQARTVTSPLAGIWQVGEFSLDGESSPQLVPDNVRWRRVIIGRSVSVQRMDGGLQRYTLDLDLAARKLVLDGEFTYNRPDQETLHLSGNYRGRPLRVSMRRLDESDFRLTSRGFRWISESPYNR